MANKINPNRITTIGVKKDEKTLDDLRVIMEKYGVSSKSDGIRIALKLLADHIRSESNDI